MTIEEISSTLNRALELAGYKPVRVLIETNEASGRDVKITEDSSSVLVHIYPVILNKTSVEAIKAILKELGDYILDKADEVKKLRWENRLVPADLQLINQFQGKLSSGKFLTFTDLVKSLPRAVDRLVAIHLSNGLLSNGQTIISSKNIEVSQWGTTSEFSTGKKLYSLIPLLSVYVPADVYQHFGPAFTDMILSGLGSVRESSVRSAYLSLITTISDTFKVSAKA